MKTRSQKSGVIRAALALSLPLFAAQGQDFSIDWFALAGGGGVSTGGVYSVSGTVGQPEVGRMSGGSYSVEGGFWAVIAEVPPPFSIVFTNSVLAVSWPLSATGFVLDQTTTLRGAPIPWAPISPPYASNATHYYITVPLPTGNRFYRLHKP